MKNFIENHSSKVSGIILDELESNDVASLNLKIAATHAGKVNGNNVFYTPRSMYEGVETLTKPFQKHLQKGHNGLAIGVITGAEYVDISNKYPELQVIQDQMNAATTSKELVEAVRALVKHETSASDTFEGLGVAEVKATLYDRDFIRELVSGENQGKVSIGGESNHVLCSICAEDVNSRHRHKRGKYYGNELCFSIYDKMALDHVGFVNKPADNTTKTTILDNKESYDSTVEVEAYKINDSLEEGHKQNMKLTYQELVEAAKSSAALAKVFKLPENKTSEIEQLLSAIKPESEASYLLPEKLLATTDKLTVAAAKLLISELKDDDKQKQVLQDLVNTQVELHFDGTSIDDFIADLAKEVEVPKVVDTVPEEVVKAAFTAEDFETIANLVAEKVSASFEKSQQAIQDSLQEQDYSILIARNKNLEKEIMVISDSHKFLTEEYKEGIISQILNLKGLNKDSEYATNVLSKRDVDQLKSTLQDLQFKEEPVKSQAKELEKASISDSLKGEKTVEVEKTKEELQKIEDSQKNVDETEQFQLDIKEHGFNKALKLRKERSK